MLNLPVPYRPHHKKKVIRPLIFLGIVFWAPFDPTIKKAPMKKISLNPPKMVTIEIRQWWAKVGPTQAGKDFQDPLY